MRLVSRLLATAAVVGGACAFGGVAAAAPITFDLTTPGLSGSPAEYQNTISGVTLTVKGYRVSGNLNSVNINDPIPMGSQMDLTQDTTGSHQGLGISDGGSSRLNGNNGTPDEIAVFAFSQTIRLVSIVFYNWDLEDDFHLAVGSSLTLMLDDEVIPGSGGQRTYTMSSMYYGDKIGIGADASGDEYRIRKITVETVYTRAIPEPATALLFGLGLAGLGVMRQRRAV